MKHAWWMAGLCLLPIAAIVAVTAFGVSLSNLLLFGMVLVCPLMHVFMMRGMGHDHGRAPSAAACHEEPAPRSTPTQG